MTLPAPRLDDLTWADMMAAIRRRIPAESDGAWTLHSPADPGVTLLELLAYLLEQRLYWLDQAPDELVVAILRLLGLDPPRPARPAATVLRLTADGPRPTLVPAGTVMSRDPAGRIRFTLDSDVAVLPLDGDVTVGTDRDRTADLLARRGVPLLAADGSAAAARFTLPLAGAHPAPGPLSLLVELDTPLPPSWSPSAVPDVPPPAALTWSWFRPGTDVSGTFAEVEDGTGGLRRSGVVRLHPPGGWTTRDRGVLVSTPAATFAAPPRLLQLAVNAGAARHLEHRTVTGAELADQLAAWLKLPGQRLALPDAAGRLLGATLRLAGETWEPAADFAFGGSRDRIFLLDRAGGALVFGDGLTGRIPRPGGDEVRVEYTVGGGRDGNGGLTGNWLPVADAEVVPGARPAEGPVAVRGANLVQAAGGADPETVAEARGRAAGTLGEVTRAVTAEDYVTLAVTTPGVPVGRAYAAPGEHPGFPCARVPGAVTVHIVPDAPRDTAGGGQVPEPRPDPGMLCAVADRLAAARLLTAEVFVRAPAYRPVRLRVDLSGRPADRARVSALAGQALRRYLDPLAGGDDGAGWPFGAALRPSALLRAAQRALGGLAHVAAVAIGLDGDAPAASCGDLDLRPGELPAVREIRTRIVPDVEPGEGLT
ncbi:baseplate J/gp47 family protein [Nonomuraea candida]|uniref:baseplate J/gp47 family protein n=1 Tax=Nonomuraea candida TaxID=359159 RepID=UPI0005BD9879|nr:baseplate J/gp47 family protein [Nonomuraea candida]